MLSAFGEYTRELRKKANESLRTMADKLDISPAYLSIMENGRRTATKEIVETIGKVYGLTDEEVKDLQNLANIANQRVELEIEEMNEAQAEVSLVFARKIKDADPDLIAKLRKVLEDESTN